MASLADIHAAIAGRLDTITGLSAFAAPPQGPRPPVAWPQLLDYEQSGFARSAVISYRFEVYVLTAATVRPQDGYGRLMDFADATGPSSIRLAIWDGNSSGTFTGTYQGTTYTLARTQVFPVGTPAYRELGAAELDVFQMYGGVFSVVVETTP